MTNGAYILQYEENESRLELLISSSDYERFLALIRAKEYPSPNKDLLQTTLEAGKIFKYCQEKFHISFIPGIMVTGNQTPEEIARLSEKIKLYHKKKKPQNEKAN